MSRVKTILNSREKSIRLKLVELRITDSDELDHLEKLAVQGIEIPKEVLKAKEKLEKVIAKASGRSLTNDDEWDGFDTDEDK